MVSFSILNRLVGDRRGSEARILDPSTSRTPISSLPPLRTWRGSNLLPFYSLNLLFLRIPLIRITHRKFETKIPLRFQDNIHMTDVLKKIKSRLQTLPKLDFANQPFRVSFVGFGTYW